MSDPARKFAPGALVEEIGRYLNRLGHGRPKEPAVLLEVLTAERAEIRQRRDKAGCPVPSENEPLGNLTGIALSGGGIRSATFCLGFLQALNRKGGLQIFDYLSTVSGGGFVGGWWSAWLTRKSGSSSSSVFPPDEAVEPAREDDYLTGLSPDMRPAAVRTAPSGKSTPPIDPVHHLRLFSNYLTPRKGLLSGDTWRAVTVVGRNLVLTWLVLLPLLLAAALAAHLYFVGHPDTAYGFACLAPSSQDQVPAASPPDICAQIRDSLPVERAYLTEESYGKALQRRLDVAARPILILGSWLLAGVAAWILAGAGSFRVMIGMMAGLLLTGITVYGTARQFGIGEWTQDLEVQWDLQTTLMLVGVAVILVFWWLIPALADRRNLSGEVGPDNTEARTNRVTRLQSALLVATVLFGAVLLLGGFGHDLFAYLFTFSTGHLVYDYVLRAGGWSAAAVTVAGLLATAFFSAPSGGGETEPQPSKPWRNVVLAVTPVLTIVMLAIGASAVAHWLLIHGRPTPASFSGVIVMTAQGIIGIGLLVALIQQVTKPRPPGTPGLPWELGLTLLIGGIAFLVPAWVADPYRQLSPLEGGLLISILVFTIFTIIEYLTDDRRTSSARRIGVTVLAVLLSYGVASMLVELGLFDSLQAFRAGPVAGQEPPARRWSAILVGAMAGLVIGRCCVMWLASRDTVLVTKPWVRPRLQGGWVWVGLVLAMIAGAGLGSLISDLPIPADALPINGHSDTVGSPLLAWVCLLALSFASCFVILDLLVSRDENTRALLLQIITLGLMGPTLMQQYLNPFGPSVVFVNASLALIGIALALVVSLGWLIGPNDISLHSFYRARLVRAYLGASNAVRRERGIGVTESVRGDDLPLHSLTNTETGGPYHIINATLNLVGGRDLATAQRSAAAFLLSKLYCGSLRTGFRPTHEYMNGELTLGTAIAISGAAASPNMGSKTPSAALAMLLALLNIRLGFWAPTPNQARWRSPVARLWPYHLLSESLSQTNDVSAYANLTDGGHFDNTGLYSLIERGCRYVVMVDCGADPRPCFADLGDAVRRCRIDFGTEISLLVKDFVPLKDSGGLARWHYVAGGIKYSREHARELGWGNASEEERKGVIVWVKPAITPDDPADVRQYALENGAFPQQSIGDQWFGEAQFESYRRLGEQCGAELVKSWGGTTGCNAKDIAKLFRRARVRYDKRSAQASAQEAAPA